MTADGYYKTGDILRRDADGFHYFVDRVDDMFVCNGENVFPVEVEKLLESHPAIKQACVVPVDDEVRGAMLLLSSLRQMAWRWIRIPSNSTLWREGLPTNTPAMYGSWTISSAPARTNSIEKTLAADATKRLAGRDKMAGHSIYIVAPNMRDLMATYPSEPTRVDLHMGANCGAMSVRRTAKISVSPCSILPVMATGIAEHAFALLMSAPRGLSQMDREMRSGTWSAFEGEELRGKTLGIVGTGAVGAELCRIAAGFGMNCIAWNRSAALSHRFLAKEVPLKQVFRDADAVSLHIAFSDTMNKMVVPRFCS